MKFLQMNETHVKGFLTVEKLPDQVAVDLGIQISEDGRVWICVDGVAFARFRPANNENIWEEMRNVRKIR